MDGIRYGYTVIHHILLDDSIPEDYRVAHKAMTGYGNAVRRLEYCGCANLRLMS